MTMNDKAHRVLLCLIKSSLSWDDDYDRAAMLLIGCWERHP